MRWINLFSLLVLLSSCQKDKMEDLSKENELREPLEITAEVDNANPTNVERVKYTITYNYENNVEFSPPEVGSEIGGFRIVDMGREGPKKVGERNELVLWYDLEPDVDGTFILPPVELSYKFNGEEKAINTNPIYINVAVAEFADGDKLIEDEALAPIPDDRLWFYPLIGLGIILLVVSIVWGLKIYSAKRADVPPLLPHEKARKRLRKLHSKNLIEKDDGRQFYFELSEITRGYTDERFILNTLESTQEEIKITFKSLNEITSSMKDDLLNFFSRSDFAKFAKMAFPREQLKTDIAMVEDFIEKSKPQPEVLKKDV